MSTIKKIGAFEFVCNYRSNRSGFVHEAEMFKNYNRISSSKCQYYNRTREARSYQSVVLGCISSKISQLKEDALDDYKYETGKKRLTKEQKDEVRADKVRSTDLYKELIEAYDLASHNHF